jgi:LemA protein
MKQVVLGLVLLVVLVVLVVGIGGCASYNRLVGSSQTVDAQWAQVQNQYQRRADLVENLVSTVKGAADFERTTLENVVQARAKVGQVQINAAQSPNSQAQIDQFAQAQGQLSSALSRLLVVAEQYPQLRATENFRDLQAQLEGTENRIAVARRDFNEAALRYNTAVRRFPTVLFAGMLGFQPKPYFTAAPEAATAPKVKFDFSRTNQP